LSSSNVTVGLEYFCVTKIILAFLPFVKSTVLPIYELQHS
jgi:hypothetical protein